MPRRRRRTTLQWAVYVFCGGSLDHVPREKQESVEWLVIRRGREIEERKRKRRQKQ